MKKIALTLLSVLSLNACTKFESSVRPLPSKETAKGDVIVTEPAPASAKSFDDTTNWFIKDPTLNNLEGVSSERAITEWALKSEKQIIVAVIDSGVDINHEDLKSKIWNNPGEFGLDANGNDKSTNGIDDDNNGYIDDVHGWNFLGGKDGRHIDHETLEVTREALRYDQILAAGTALSPEEKAYYEKVKADYDEQLKSSQDDLKILQPVADKATAAQTVLKDKLGLEDYAKEKLDAITSTDADVIKAKDDLLAVIKDYRNVPRFFRILDATKESLDYNLNKNFNARAIVGDDPYDFSQVDYGNNDVQGPDASHGTHVSGLIGAESDNGIGIDGVARNVKIMVLRAVPNGDERDKDVALAVRYAVKNGANVINMSFGKSYSPQKAEIDKEFLAAAEKGVLIFHSAGNGASDNDSVAGYPNRHVLNSSVLGSPEIIPTWLEIGASAKTKGLNMVASFSDYGRKDVDFFSPGFEVNSTVPGNLYAVYSGTSMAGPVAAGVGALMLSNFPTMTAAQAKAILMREARQYPGLDVHLPGSAPFDLPVPFASLSATGGVVDAYSSILLARKLSGL